LAVLSIKKGGNTIADTKLIWGIEFQITLLERTLDENSRRKKSEEIKKDEPDRKQKKESNIKVLGGGGQKNITFETTRRCGAYIMKEKGGFRREHCF